MLFFFCNCVVFPSSDALQYSSHYGLFARVVSTMSSFPMPRSGTGSSQRGRIWWEVAHRALAQLDVLFDGADGSEEVRLTKNYRIPERGPWPSEWSAVCRGGVAGWQDLSGCLLFIGVRRQCVCLLPAPLFVPSFRGTPGCF